MKVASAAALVLIAAGSVPTPAGASLTEVAEAWTPAGTMTSARSLPTASVLPDGRVLVAGGGPVVPVTYDTSYIGGASSAETLDPATGVWKSAAHMRSSRVGHSATLLSGPRCKPPAPDYCGQVLVAGGGSDQAELYDPRVDGWSATGSFQYGALPAMNPMTGSAVQLDAPRCRSASPPDWCGKVLFIANQLSAATTGSPPVVCCTGSGTTVPVPLSPSELYDPGAGTWSSCPALPRSSACPGPLNTPRQDFTATLLTDGRVLVTGGHTRRDPHNVNFGANRSLAPDDYLQSAELYDPDFGTWSATSPMSVVRAAGHSATLLNDGRVLVVGGQDMAGVLTWEQNFGFTSAIGFRSSAEVFEPSTQTWTTVAPMVAARGQHSSSLLSDGRVLVSGGRSSGNLGYDLLQTVLTSSEIYNPSTDEWKATGSLGTGRQNHVSVTLAGGACKGASPPAYCGGIVVIGGTSGSGNFSDPNPQPSAIASAESYQPAEPNPVPTVFGISPDHVWPAGRRTMTVQGTHFTGVTGVQFGAQPAAAPTIVSDTQLRVHIPSQPAGKADVVLLKGAMRSNPVPLTYAYPTAGSWSDTDPLTGARDALAAVLLEGPACARAHPSRCGKVLVAGGAADASAELYDPQTGVWRRTGDMVVANRSGASATLLAGPGCAVATPAAWCGRVLVSGGGSDQAEVYDPETDAWSATGSFQNAGSAGPAVLLTGHACEGGSPPSWCGKVLATGSDDNHGLVLPRSELYDPATGAWSSCAVTGASAVCPGRPVVPRNGATVTVLPDGRVLMAGGQGLQPDATVAATAPVLCSAEVYDPQTGTWSATGSMTAARYMHTATALPNGTVLVVAGGRARGTSQQGCVDRWDLRTAEIYDPATGRWATTGSLALSRLQHAAVLLPTGKVLVAGGAPAAAELYDPVSGSWQPTGLLAPRMGLTLTPLSGPECAAASAPDYCGAVLAVGGHDASNVAVPAGALYEPTGGAAVAVTVDGVTPSAGTMGGGRTITITGGGFTGATGVRFGEGGPVVPAAIPSDTTVTAVVPAHDAGPVDVMVLKGGTESSRTSADRYTFMPTDGVWMGTGSMNHTHGAASAVMLSGPACVHAVAAACGQVLVPDGHAELFNPLTGTWRTTGPTALPRVGYAAVALADGRVVASGGDAKGTTAEVFDPNAGSWTATGSMVDARHNHTATLLSGRACGAGGPGVCGQVLAVGGDDSPLTAELLDPAASGGLGSWSPTAPPAAPRSGHVATLLTGPSCSSTAAPPYCGSVLIVGGVSPASASEPVGTAEVYDPASRSWACGGAGAPPCPANPGVAHGRGATATVLADGRVLLVGGDVSPRTAEMYDPSTGSWRAVPPPLNGHLYHQADLLPDGRVLVASIGSGSNYLDASAEIYDPSLDSWHPAGELEVPRYSAASVTLPPGPVSQCGTSCGKVLIAAGTAPPGPITTAFQLDSAELYAVTPVVRGVSPAHGTARGGARLTITGVGLASVKGVSFGGVPAKEVRVDPGSPDTTITATSPPVATRDAVDITVTTDGGTSAPLAGDRYVYDDVPRGVVGDLAATTESDTVLRLTFNAPWALSSGGGPPASYVVRTATSPITDEAAFERATSLCGGVCTFTPGPTEVGQALTLSVSQLVPGTRYHFSLRAVGPGGALGPLSNDASAVTQGVAPAPSCLAPAVAGAGQHFYPGGYSIVGLPGGTVPSESPLYNWTDQGRGGKYTVQDASQVVSPGRGYWAYFACGRPVTVAEGGGTSAAIPLHRYHASMVGNPSGSFAVTVTGFDYAARWNAETRSYEISSRRQPVTLAVGEGIWVFSFTDTVVHIHARAPLGRIRPGS